MADIKTRDVVKVMIKTIDKSATASHRIKSAYIQTKDKVENSYYKNEDFSDDYATDKVSKMGHRVAEESKKQLSKQRQKGAKNSKDNIQKTRARINSRKQQKVGNETYRTTCVSGKDIHRADKDILKIQTHKSSQNTNKSIKTAQRTKKTIKQTTRCSGGKIKPSAKGTVKSAKSSFKITEQTTARKAPHIFKSTKEVTRATIKVIMAGTKSLVSAIVAGGWVAVILIVIICITGMVASSCFGILFSNEDTGSPQNMSAVVHEVNDEYQTRLDEIEAENNCDVLDVSGSLAAWKEVLSVYAIKVTTDGNEPQEVATKELLEDFEELKQYNPFILFTKESWALLSDVFHESKLNDNKHRMRGVRRHDLFGYIDGETELYTKEAHEDVVISEVVQKFQAEQVSKALDKLTPTQKRRINLYYFSELTLLEISNIESTSIKQVHKSIRLAKDKLKKLLK